MTNRFSVVISFSVSERTDGHLRSVPAIRDEIRSWLEDLRAEDLEVAVTTVDGVKKDIRPSATFRCAECGRRLLEVRDKPGTCGFDLRCPICDRDLLSCR